MSTYKEPDFEQRQNAAKTAKTAMLHKFRVASDDPAVAERQAERLRVNEARLARLAQREAAKRLQEAQLAEQAARNAELALQAQQEAAKVEALKLAEKAANEAMLEAERKAARDARYAARKAAKKIRRRGY